MKTISLLKGQVSQITYVPIGSRITSSGNGSIEWTPGSETDAKNAPTWKAWAKGSAAGFMDTLRPLSIRATATGNMTITIVEGDADKYVAGEYFNDTGLVGPDGTAHSGDWPRTPTVSNFDIFDTYREGPRRKMTLPNPYSAVGPDMVHPSVVHVPSGWMGWKYWMAYTPYPTANSDYENPCVAVSQDGETWETPFDVINPLVGKPAGGYNADTHIFFAPDYSRLYIAYAERIGGVSNKVRVMESTDGRKWTAPVTIITGTYGSQHFASPSIWYNPTTAKWNCISHNADGGVTFPMQLTQSLGSDIYAGWGAPAAITIEKPIAGRTYWHSAFDRLPDGRIIGLVQDVAENAAGTPGRLYAAESFDGGLTIAVRLVYNDLGFYRPNFNLVEAGGEWRMIAWIGRQDTGGFHIDREDWRVGAVEKALVDSIKTIQLTGSYPASYLWWDNFNRADGAIGTPTIGTALTVDVGSFTIASNKIATGTAGNNRALTTIASSNYAVETIFSASTAAAWLWFRAVDTSNFYRLGVGAGLNNTLYLEKFVGGAMASQTVVSGPVFQSILAPGDKVRVVCRGRRFRIYVNDTFWQEVQDTSYFTTGVKAGVQGTNAGVSFDYLLIVS